jgi:hypothetical protein
VNRFIPDDTGPGAIETLSDAVRYAIAQISKARDAAIQAIDDAFVERIVIKCGPLTPEMQTRLDAMRTARSNAQSIIVDSEDQAIKLFRDDPAAPHFGQHKQPAEIFADLEKRTLEIYARRRAERGDPSPSRLSGQVVAAIQAIVELLARSL